MKAVILISSLLIVSIGYSQSGRGGYYLLKSHEAIDRKKIKVAEQYADSALMSAIRSNNLDSLTNAYLWLSEVYGIKEDYQKSLQNFKMVIVYRDSLARIRQKATEEDANAEMVLLKNGHQKELNSYKEQIKNLELISDRAWRNSLIIIIAILVLSIVIMVSLVRRRNETKEQLEQTKAELEQLQSFREKLFTVLSFELKNSLSSFEKLTQGLASQIPSLNKEDSIRFLENLHSTAGDLKVNLNNVVQWAGYKADSKSFHPMLFDAKDLALQTIEKFKIQLDAKNLTSHLFMPPDGQMVFADKEMIGVVLDNLMSNSIQSTPEGGAITVFSGRKDGLVTLGVKDSGIGMSEETQDKLFVIEKDNALSGGSANKKMKLGLVLSKELVELNGGRIYVESVLGTGSTIYFSLPERG